MPVQGVLKEATCTGGAISRQGAKTSTIYLRTVYEFASRSKDHASNGTPRPVPDEITEFVEYDTTAECETAAASREVGSRRTVWAGEDPVDDRFRARLTSEREHPSPGLLWVPACFAAVGFWGWRRATR